MVVKVACVTVLDCTQRRDFVVIHVVMDRAMQAASESDTAGFAVSPGAG